MRPEFWPKSGLKYRTAGQINVSIWRLGCSLLCVVATGMLKRTVTGIVCLHMLQEWLMPLVQEWMTNKTYSIRVPYRRKVVGNFFIINGLGVETLGCGPPRLPNLAPTDYFSWKFVKGNVCVSTLPVILEDLRTRITEANAISDHDTIQKCGRRLNIGLTGTVLQVGRSRHRFPMVSLEFFIDINLSVALWPWGRLSL
jgi:hypothetical protein